MIRRPGLLSLVVAGIVALAVTPAAAASSTSARSVGGTSAVTFPVPGGTVKAGWVSNKDLAANPSLYRQLRIPTPAERMAASKRQYSFAAVTPATSGTNCDGVLCAKVYGTGLRITSINTTAQGNVGCTNAHFVIVRGTDFGNGPILRTAVGSVVCATGPGPGTYCYNFNNNVPDRMPYTCPTTSTVAVFWDFLAGEPMFTIHA